MNSLDMFYSITEFADRIHVSVCTLRNWDKSGFLKPHHKTHGNHRIYSEEQALCYLSEPVFQLKCLMVDFSSETKCCIQNAEEFTNEEFQLLYQHLKNLIVL